MVDYLPVIPWGRGHPWRPSRPVINKTFKLVPLDQCVGKIPRVKVQEVNYSDLQLELSRKGFEIHSCTIAHGISHLHNSEKIYKTLRILLYNCSEN